MKQPESRNLKIGALRRDTTSFQCSHLLPTRQASASSITTLGDNVAENSKLKFQNHRQFRPLAPFLNWLKFSGVELLMVGDESRGTSVEGGGGDDQGETRDLTP